MTRLEQLEHRLNYLLSLYDERKNEPSYKLQLALVSASYKRQLDAEKPLEVD